MSRIDEPHDHTTERMIEAVTARGTKPEADALTFALLEAGFKGFDIGLRLDTVMAGARKLHANLVLARAL